MRKSNVTEKGKKDGRIDLTVAGGTPPYSYSWDTGQSTQDIFNLAAGIYTVEITDDVGCTSQTAAVITEPDNPLKISLKGELNCASGSDGSIDLTITGGTPPFKIEWSNGETTKDVSGLSEGTYSVKVSDNLFTETAEIELSPENVIEIRVETTNVCTGQTAGTARASASGGKAPYRYSWSSGSTTEEALGLIAGEYTLTVTDANTCVSEKVFDIEEFEAPVITLEDHALECGEAKTIAAETGFVKYEWTGVSASNYVAQLSENGVVSLTVTDTNGCTASDDFNVTVSTETSINMGDDRSNCTGEPIQITAPSGFSDYQWSTGQNTQTITVTSSATLSLVATGTDGCIAKDEIAVNISTTPNFDLGTTKVGCDSEPVLLTGPAGYADYTWSTGLKNQTLAVTTAGEYSLTARNAAGCKGYDAVMVEIYESPVVPLPETVKFCQGKNEILDAGTDGTKYVWNDESASQTLEVATEGLYTVEVSNENCSTTKSTLVIFEDCDCKAEAPNIFTPNGDSTNDTFHVIWENNGGEIVKDNVFNYEMKIFTRWGKLIYSTTDQNKPWDGRTNSGTKCPTGQYYFSIRYQCPDKSGSLNGHLMLITN